ncbi:MAG: hypothetical protein MJ180_01160 [Candidatus Gastranaerophilales bacterium]|nr:hypothetical protein [Candidatus Gastranaerophilales bacterium]
MYIQKINGQNFRVREQIKNSTNHIKPQGEMINQTNRNVTFNGQAGMICGYVAGSVAGLFIALAAPGPLLVGSIIGVASQIAGLSIGDQIEDKMRGK